MVVKTATVFIKAGANIYEALTLANTPAYKNLHGLPST